MPSPSPSELRCQATALRHAARRTEKSSISNALIEHARRLETEAEHIDHGSKEPAPAGDKLPRRA